MNKEIKEHNDDEETTDETSFEDNLEQLEDIVSRLEQGDLPLEEALELYEKGVSAYRDCHQKLENAESKVV
ncbi:MAG: exodeoxyribonuclease VII small subunit, partial [Planctomycetota bacterium]